jgi:hypothetical protein
MTTYRKQLPQLGEELFLSDGGLETTLIFHNGMDLPHFASFVLSSSWRTCGNATPAAQARLWSAATSDRAATAISPASE